MFEEVCLVCGKDILHPQSVYCSNACADSDWSSSSTCSSPSSTSAEVPPLYTHRASISSASSNSSWSLASDDLDQADNCRIIDEDNPQMSYARKPSGTTNQAIVPLLLSRSTSDSYETISPKRRPYASSLPPYFASLAISSKKPPITMTPSSFTVTSHSPSPPTPKVPFKLSPIQPAQPQLTTPAPRERGRGRRREESTDSPRTRSRRRRSTSRSHSRSLLDWQLPSPTSRRGRATAEELDGWGSSHFAPGYGTGRSGLVHRQQRHGTKI